MGSRSSRHEKDTYFQTLSTPPRLLELWPYRLPKAWCSPGCFLLCDAILLLVIRHVIPGTAQSSKHGLLQGSMTLWEKSSGTTACRLTASSPPKVTTTSSH